MTLRELHNSLKLHKGADENLCFDSQKHWVWSDLCRVPSCQSAAVGFQTSFNHCTPDCILSFFFFLRAILQKATYVIAISATDGTNTKNQEDHLGNIFLRM